MLLRVTAKLWRKYNTQHNARVEEYAKQGKQNYESSVEDFGGLQTPHSKPRTPARRRSSRRMHVVPPPPAEHDAEGKRKSVFAFLRIQGR